MKKSYDTPVLEFIRHIINIKNQFNDYPGYYTAMPLGENDINNTIELSAPKTWKGQIQTRAFKPNDKDTNELIANSEIYFKFYI